MQRVLLLVLAAAAGSGVWLWNYNPQFRDTLTHYVDTGTFVTLEARYNAEQLMTQHRQELLGDNQHTFQDPVLQFYPYLLIEAKYLQPDKKTREGMTLWGLTDGEMVLDTETWETTHGFEDAILAGADRNDFRLLYELTKNGGSSTREILQRDLQLEPDALDVWIESALNKQLIAQSGNELQVHLQNPKIIVSPQTRFKQAFATKPSNQAERATRRYSRSQVEKVAQAAFGPSFTIRKVTEVFLPVYCLSVQNPDGSVYTSYWNALTGQPLKLALR